MVLPIMLLNACAFTESVTEPSRRVVLLDMWTCPGFVVSGLTVFIANALRVGDRLLESEVGA
jgi:hypothetical protein